ncbi:hypothetical protein LJR030_000270 [Rhizobium sp. LjRoot30]|uniref:cache domain-containing protein n=1 Tax=Rhizobium sp. LjRoot30 TaxID=3342320 RepID=UPI003ECF937F
MKFRRDAPIILSIAIAIVIAVAAAISSQLFAGMTAAVEEKQFELMGNIVQTAIGDAENKALARAELIGDLPAVQRLLTANDRAGLQAELGKMFENQKARHGVDQAQFHQPPALSFLRLHDPATFGDDLTASRPLVVAVNRDREPRKGPSVARNGPAIFGVAPVTDSNGKPWGTFEVGISFGPLLAGLKNAYGFDLALFIDEGVLRQFAKGVSPERLGDQNRVGKFMRFEATNAALMSELATASDLAVVSEPTPYTRLAQGMTRGVLLIPLNNSSGTQIGVIAVSSDFSASRASVGRSLVWQTVIAAISIVLLIGVVIVVLRGFLMRPLQVLGDCFEAVSSNELLPPLEGAERFPKELQVFAAMYERIRLRRLGAGKVI